LADLLPAYGLGCTDADESAYVKAALAADPAAAALLADYAALARSLLYSAPPVSAPAHLAERLEAALAQETAAAAPRPAVAPPTAATPRRWSWWSRSLQPALAVVALLLLALNVYWAVANRALRRERAELVAQVDRQNEALLLLLEQQPQQVVLPAAPEGGTAEATVRWRTGAHIAVLEARNFPPLPPDRVYQLWLTNDGVRTSGGLFTVDSYGNGALAFESPLPLEELDALGVTPEPAGGSPGPTAPPVVRVQL
jgi:anti-sigma factor RsiW